MKPAEHGALEEDKNSPHENIKTLKRRGSKFELQQTSMMERPNYAEDKEVAKPKGKGEKMWELMDAYMGNDIHSIQRQIVNHVEYTMARTRFNFDNNGCYYATSYSMRDRLLESWNDTNLHVYRQDPKRVYYMSLEFLLGRLLQNALVCTDLEEKYKTALNELGYKLEDVYEEEVDPGLGNGGLGRLAACFLDSLATLELPGWGYGIRYNYGIFKQEIKEGHQMELPDYWLSRGNPWEIERNDVLVPVQFYGKVEKYHDHGVERCRWSGEEMVQAQAYDTPIPGYNTFNTNNLRLWRACPSAEFDFRSFNSGDYFGAVKAKQKAESISSVLYPNDMSMEGKELRLKQEYFFCAATLKDVIRRFFKKRAHDWKNFPEKVAIQLNDTHPTLAIVELLRLLLDEYKLPYDQAMDIVSKTFSYTNHTVLPEALEKWDVALIQKLLPRHMDLIYLMNFFFLESVKKVFGPNNYEKMSSLSFIEEGESKKVRMANICCATCHKINGVAALHTDILRKHLFKDFVEYFNKLDYNLYKDRIINITNGVTPRRWVACTNPEMTAIITQKLGHAEWINDYSKVRDIEKFAGDEDFQKQWAEVKRTKKQQLADAIKRWTGISVSTNMLFDVLVKRIHEYKRQLMDILYIAHRYLWIKEMKPQDRANVAPRAALFGGKAAPGYANAKNIIRLINAIGYIINSDPEVDKLLKVVFMPNYSVSRAQIIIPGSELSQQISTAGMEASGTSNMKFAMNGTLIIGTMDGANVEIAEEIGKENMFIFGANVEDINKYKKRVFFVKFMLKL